MSKGVGEQGNRGAREQGSKGSRDLAGGRFPLSLVLLLPLSSLFFGCAAQPVVVNPAFDFSKVRRISVAPFDGQGGQAVSDELVRQLVGTGIEVTDARHAGDVVLRGSVIEYKTNNQLMVFLGDDNPVVSPSSQATPEGIPLSAHKAPVASVLASVGIQTRLTDASNRIVWADSYSYEGLDLPTALGATVGSLMRSLKRVVPQMRKPKPA